MISQLTTKLDSNAIQCISEHLVDFQNYIPIEFYRKSRSLQDDGRPVNSEALYYGPIVLKGYAKPLQQLCYRLGELQRSNENIMGFNNKNIYPDIEHHLEPLLK